MYELIQYGALFLVCTYLVLTYSAPSVSNHVKFWSIVTWTLNFAMCLLVPEDVYLTLKTRSQGAPINQQQQGRLMFEYLLCYWSVYILTWTIIPVLQEWENSGDIDSMDRLKRSLKVNGIFYLYMFVGGVASLVLLYYLEVGGQMGLKTYLKCLATCWGIILQMGMMGYAMVEIPRSLWMSGHSHKYLHYCYQKIRELEENKQSAIFEFKQIASFAIHSKIMQPRQEQIQRYSEITLALIPAQLQHHIPKDESYKDFIKHLQYADAYPVGLESSIEHYRLMKRVVARHRRLTKSLSHFIDQAILYEDIIDSLAESRPRLQSEIIAVSSLNSLWYLKLAPIAFKSLAVGVSIFSGLILMAETQMFLSSGEESLLGWLLLFENLQILRVLVYIVIVFISYMVYYSLFRIKLSNTYGLYKHESDGPSLMFATINFSRVAFAIVLNFFQMLKLDGVYVQAMGTVEMGLLGEWIIKGIPGVLWLIVLCHYYDIWGKIITQFSLSEDLRFDNHRVDSSSEEKESRLKNIPFLVRKRRIELKVDRENDAQVRHEPNNYSLQAKLT